MPNVFDIQNRIINACNNELYNTIQGYSDIARPLIEAMSRAVALELNTLLEDMKTMQSEIILLQRKDKLK